MFRPAAIFIGLRYTRAKRRNHFISFISLMSILGIALGVLVLITVLSVMNGFDREIKKYVFSMIPPVTVGSSTGAVTDWSELEKNLLDNYSNVLAVAPFVSGQVLLTNGGLVQPAMVNGIIPEQEKKISALSDKIVAGSLDSLTTQRFGIILGQDLADRLGVSLGDKVTVVTPEVSVSIAGVTPRFKRFTVTGIFHAGNNFGFDGGLAFIALPDAQKLLELGNAVTAVHVNISNVYDARRFSNELRNELSPNVNVSNWTDQYGAFFQTVSLEKTMMFFILLLIVAVAIFNLVSTLVMVVNEKEADIAILRTYGATPRLIMTIFIVQGAIIGVFGTLLGVVGGIELATHVTPIIDWIQSTFHVQLISKFYFVDYLPSELQWKDVLQIGGTSLVLSLLATIYPAWRAGRTEPVEALRYE